MANLKKLSEQKICDKGQKHLEAAHQCFEEMIRRSCTKSDGVANANYRIAQGLLLQATGMGLKGIEADSADVIANFGSK